MKNRIVSIDIFRGITVALMILVNNPGAMKYTWQPLKHVPWEGFSPADAVFPFFVVIMGISIYISLAKFEFIPTKPLVIKILKRTVLLFLLGFALNWIDLYISTLARADNQNAVSLLVSPEIWQKVRVLGVLQRLALGYGAASLLVVLLRGRRTGYLAAALLLVYTFILLVGSGFECSVENIISRVDRTLLGEGHLYALRAPGGNRIPLDPEGLLSTIPVVAHVLIGFGLGKALFQNKSEDINLKIRNILLAGAALLISGYLLSYVVPIIKNAWTPTYVLVACGFGALVLGLLMMLVDVKGKQKTLSMLVGGFGVNPLALYLFSELIVIPLKAIKFNFGGEMATIRSRMLDEFLYPVFGNALGSFMFSFVILLICWLLGYYLNKKKIFIKL